MCAARTAPLPEDLSGVASRRTPACIHAAGFAEDLFFLTAWERGLVPWPGAILRVRQIRRATPALAAAVRAEAASWSRTEEGATSCSPARRSVTAKGERAHGP